uniref:Uncharacterized protein n=1 Tax=Moniliophthora roreri TaxID=221103 RepID=A0A0W0G0T3_MONRR
MSADASSSTQQSTDSYKTMEEYPASTIPDLGGHMYSRLTHTWDNPEVLKAMSLDMPIVEFPAEVAEPEFPLLPRIMYEEIENGQITVWLEEVKKAEKKVWEEREHIECAEKERVEKE